MSFSSSSCVSSGSGRVSSALWPESTGFAAFPTIFDVPSFLTLWIFWVPTLVGLAAIVLVAVADSSRARLVTMTSSRRLFTIHTPDGVVTSDATCGGFQGPGRGHRLIGKRAQA